VCGPAQTPVWCLSKLRHAAGYIEHVLLLIRRATKESMNTDRSRMNSVLRLYS
jgi:hypothetical protein